MTGSGSLHYNRILYRLLVPAVLLWLTGTAHADIAIIVHPDNPLSSLQESDLKKIFLGRMPLFPQTRQEIHPFDLPEDHPVFVRFYQQVLQQDGAKLKRYRAYYLFSGRGRLPTSARSTDDMISQIAQDPAAIGYIDASQSSRSIKVLLTLPAQPPSPPEQVTP